jgi:hypothetical protein
MNSRIKNPLFNRTTLNDYKLDGKTSNKCDYLPLAYDYKVDNIKYNKKFNRKFKLKTLIKDSTHTISYPN